MPQRPFIELAGDLSGWPKGFVPSPAFLRKLDQFSSELVNGDEGGSWEPEDPIVLGPVGATTMTFSSGNSLLSGDVETVKGNADDETVNQAGLILTGGAAPIFETSRTRDIVVPLGIHIEALSGSAQNNPRFEIDPLTLGARRIISNNTSDILTVPLPIRAQHSGATIASVDFRFQVASQRSALPSTMPRVRVARLTGGTIAPLQSSTSSPYDANGWYVDQAGTASAYFNNGQTRTLTYTCNQNNASLDQSNKLWMVQIRDEGGGNNFVGNIFLSAVVHLTSIADFRQE